jgi:hypothetical protein
VSRIDHHGKGARRGFSQQKGCQQGKQVIDGSLHGEPRVRVWKSRADGERKVLQLCRRWILPVPLFRAKIGQADMASGKIHV